MEAPWYSYLTIDLFATVLNRSIFHPFIAWLIPLCLRAVIVPYDAPEFIAACVWATLVTIINIFAVFDYRLAYGTPRAMDWDEEVVVITGGARGLGKILADMYAMRRISVAVLDVTRPENEDEGSSHAKLYQCDVGDAVAIEQAKQQIESDLGTPTILINNAGIVHGKALLSLAAGDIERNFSVNLLSHFHTIRAFLPGMLRSETGGTVVTISSVLGKLGASHLSDYTAAKAGLIAMHASLRAELASKVSAPEGADNIRTILVTPGQLNTELFQGVATPSTFFGPVVESVELAKAIMRMIDAGESGDISMPLYARWMQWLHVLPASVQKLARWVSGVDRAMEAAMVSKATRVAGRDSKRKKES